MNIGIVILNHKNITDTVECIESIKKLRVSEDVNINMYLIDNSPSKRYINEIKTLTSGFKSIYLEKNEGYASGNNIGIKLALKDSCEYVVIINNDTIVESTFLTELLKAYKKYENIGIASPLIRRYSDKIIWSSGGKFRRFLFNYKMESEPIDNDVKSEFITGCCFIGHKKVFLKEGLIPEDYFMYGEDSAYCHNLTIAGYDNYVIKNSTIYHKISATSGIDSLFSTYYIYRNRMLFAYLNFKGLNKYFAVISNIIQCFIRCLYFLAKGKKQHALIMIFAIMDRKNKGKSTRNF